MENVIPERPARFDNWPEYVKSYVRQLESLLQGAREALDREGVPEGNNTLLGLRYMDKPQMPLGKDPWVEHAGPDGQSIAVTFDNGRLEIHGQSGNLRVYPRVANVVHIEVERRRGEFG